jgi:hypothetical protein
MASDLELEETILNLLNKAGPGKSIAPMDAAVAVAGKDEKEWRRLMVPIKQIAKRLATQGSIQLMRHSKPIPVEELKGLYRMRLPDAE